MRRDSALGYGFLFVGSGVSYLLEQFLGSRVALACAVVFSIAGVLFLVRGHIGKDVENPMKIGGKVIVCILAAACVVAIAILGRKVYLRPEHEAGSVSDKVPHLGAELLLSSSKDGISTRTNIQNIGPTTIRSVRSLIEIEGAQLNHLTPLNSEIVPFGKQQIAGPPLPESPVPQEALLVVEYESVADGIPSQYHAIYHFLITSNSAEAIAPTVTEEAPGRANITPASNAAMAKFCSPVGTLMIAFPERKPHGSPNQMSFKCQYRAFAVNEVTGRAAISAQGAAGFRAVSQDLKPQTNGRHIIFVEWDDSKSFIAIAVDGSTLTK